MAHNLCDLESVSVILQSLSPGKKIIMRNNPIQIIAITIQSTPCTTWGKVSEFLKLQCEPQEMELQMKNSHCKRLLTNDIIGIPP